MDNDQFGASLAIAKARARRGPRKSDWGSAFIALGITVVIVIALGAGMVLIR